ncbi:hypothetical protein ACN28E_02455 [Archangium lansingense]|uniref:hypothetical protein n=1 Tax=Archangium lansingense TaxID=2995310 RepID=UPI003B8168D9
MIAPVLMGWVQARSGDTGNGASRQSKSGASFGIGARECPLPSGSPRFAAVGSIFEPGRHKPGGDRVKPFG